VPDDVKPRLHPVYPEVEIDVGEVVMIRGRDASRLAQVSQDMVAASLIWEPHRGQSMGLPLSASQPAAVLGMNCVREAMESGALHRLVFCLK